MRKSLIASFLVISILLSAFVGACVGSAPTSEDFIREAYEQGIIDFDTQALYLTYSIYEPEALPSEYQSNVPAKDATSIILEIQRNWDRLSAETQQEISRYIQPLEEEGYYFH